MTNITENNMGLSIQQEIADLKNKLEELEGRIKEEEEITFAVTFIYKTQRSLWAFDGNPQEIKRHVADLVPEIADTLQFNEEGEDFYIESVKTI